MTTGRRASDVRVRIAVACEPYERVRRRERRRFRLDVHHRRVVVPCPARHGRRPLGDFVYGSGRAGVSVAAAVTRTVSFRRRWRRLRRRRRALSKFRTNAFPPVASSRDRSFFTLHRKRRERATTSFQQRGRSNGIDGRTDAVMLGLPAVTG